MNKSYLLLLFLLYLIPGKSKAQYRDLLDFNVTNGTSPFGNVILSDKLLYGMTGAGGSYNSGCIFSIDTNGIGYKDLFDFNGSNGGGAQGSLILSGGILYGMTSSGGLGSGGNIFSIDTNGSNYKDLLGFVHLNGEPKGSLTLSGGELFGMTWLGGNYMDGNVFSIDTDGTRYKDLFEFDGTNGESPIFGQLTLSGKVLYGMTQMGGNDGVIFSIDSNDNNFTDLLIFNGTNGSHPEGSLTLSGKMLYGMTAQGGANGDGIIFSIDTNGNEYKDLFDFDGTNGLHPDGSLTIFEGILYGMTENGGAYNYGLIFSIDTNGSGYKDLFDFNGSNGSNPYGSLTLSGNMLYGMTKNGGANGVGVIFSYNTCTLGITASTTSNVSCNGGNNGSVLATPTDGTSPYTYSWSDGGTKSSKTGLSSGTYIVYVNDNHGCISSASTTITQPTLLEVTANATINVTCNGGNNGIVSATPSGGTSPYTYSWSNGGTNSTKSGLSIGTFTITLKDKNGCTSSSSISITQPPLLIVTANVTTNVSCNGGNNCKLSSTYSGGTSPYTYSWSPSGQTTTNATGLSVGTYTITAKDINGCTATADAIITQPINSVAITIASHTNVLCNGNTTGSATANVATGGTTPYTYSWSPSGGSNLTASNLSVGIYTITAKDNQGCSVTASVNITQPAIINANATTTANVSCNAENNGIVSSSPTGGTTPYTYSWSPTGGTNSTKSNLSIGTYIITVTDKNGCTGTAATIITQPNVLTLSIASQTNVLCKGDNTGNVLANTATGGTSPYAYSWSPSGQTSTNATGLSAGTYTITAKDINGCTATAKVTITQPANALAITLASPIDVKCNGDLTGSATAHAATGGTSPYTYLWSNGGTNLAETGLSAGNYTITVTDNNGCTTTASSSITQPPALVFLKDSAVNNTSTSGCNGKVIAMVNGGVNPYHYSWSNSAKTTPTITGLCAGTYCCYVTDKNGCIDSSCVIVSSTVGIPDINSGSGGIVIYPNPNTGQFTIQWSVVSSQWSVEVYNVLGEKVYSQINIKNSTFNINLSNQSNGIYLVRILSKEGALLTQKKVVKTE